MFETYTLHHVGIVLSSMRDVEEHMATFGLTEDYRGYVERWHCWCVFTRPAGGGAAIELVVADDGPLLRFNQGVGGVHHFAYQIADFAEAERWCAERDLRLLEPAPIKGAGDFWCNFIHPASTRGVQIELVQPW
ncbi:VOC family protein [Tsuneonella mangrovi]|uniref:VOC family protein n=1 Tax=Tsuneonella mangrovi TaxID=1982042 RepID=UPI000BA29A1C|nr:VOC family protein [Tsuneonella mangrovi]